MAGTPEEHLGAVLARRRGELGLTQLQVAKSTGHDRTHISDLERGKKNMSVVTLIGLARALRAAPSSLLREAERRFAEFESAEAFEAVFGVPPDRPDGRDAGD